MKDYSNLLPKNKISGQKFYLTREGLENIKKEYQNLKEIKLFKVKGEMPQFLHSDDLDPEYLTLQDDLSLLDAKIADLKYIVENTELIKTPPKKKQNIVQIGAEVFLEIDGQEDKFKIVGTLEANPSLGLISNESPVGRALLGYRVGDEVVISSPIKTHYKIKKIKYSKS